MMTGIVQDENLEKQIEKHIGCMAGFLHIFSPYQALPRRKRLPPSTGLNSARETPKVVDSPAIRAPPLPDPSWPSPLKKIRSLSPELGTPLETLAARLPFPFPVFKFKEGTRSPSKFLKEAPRLSLDSRVMTDTKGSLYPREICTNAMILPATRPDKATREAELRRSASESRINKDIYQLRKGAASGFHMNQLQQFNMQRKVAGSAIRKNAAARGDKKSTLSVGHDARNGKAERAKAAHRGFIQRKSYDSMEFFPKPKQTVSIYAENEKKLRTRGIDDESSKELDALKQILEALQPKGLLQSKHSNVNPRNVLYKRNFNNYPIVIMRQSRSSNLYDRKRSNSLPPSFRLRPAAAHGSPGTVSMEVSPAASPWHENVKSQNRRRSSVSPTRSDNGVNSPSRRRPFMVEHQRRANGATELQQVSPVQSLRIGLRRTGLDQSMTMSQSPRSMAKAFQEEEEVFFLVEDKSSPISESSIRPPSLTDTEVPKVHSMSNYKRSMAKAYQEEEEEEVFFPAEDESSPISESSISTPSLTDTERSKMVECKEGQSLLERSDKLLQPSITEITAVAESQQRPSPVSLVDSSYKELSPHLPIMKHSIEFEDQVVKLDNDARSPVSPISCKLNKNVEDCDYVYISDILRESSYFPEDSDAFLLLEEQQYHKGKDTSQVSRLQRRLIFDTVAKILDQMRHLLQWKSLSIESLAPKNPSLQQIWSEYQRIRGIRVLDNSDYMLGVLHGIIVEDLTRDWINSGDGIPMQVSRDIAWLIFRDLISETIKTIVGLDQ